MPAKGEKLSPEQRAAISAKVKAAIAAKGPAPGRGKSKKTLAKELERDLNTPASPTALPLLAKGELPDDLIAAHQTKIEQTIIDMVSGIKIARAFRKKTLKRGEAEYECTDLDDQVWWVYTQPPNPALLRFAAEQLRGKAQAKEAATRGNLTVLNFTVPGYDTVLIDHLASLTQDQLDAYHFSDDMLQRIQQAKEQQARRV